MCEVWLADLLPQLAAVRVEEVEVSGDLLRISARTRDDVPALCPGCGTASDWVHSRYVRHVADEAVGGRAVVIDLSVRRLYCENSDCPKATFAEQITGLTVRYQRRTPALQALVTAVGIALAGKAGARLLLHLHQVLSWATVLNIVLALPPPTAPTPSVLGVDDFALRRSARYGTLLVDVETRLPIALWPGRDAAALAAWLRAHPGIEAVCRDGSAEFRAGINAGAPHALQISDRFHLWQSLTGKVYDAVAAHRRCLTPPRPPAPDLDERTGDEAARQQAADGPGEGSGPVGRAAERAYRTHTAVHQLLDQGLGIRAVARRLGIGRHTVQRYARAADWHDKVPAWPRRASVLDAHRTYLDRRWCEGEHNGIVLHQELTARGYGGGYSTVRGYLAGLREHGAGSEPETAAPPTPREVTGWLTHRPEKLTEEETTALKQLLERCPELAAVHDHVRAFATMLTSGSADGLTEWIAAVAGSGLPALPPFAHGLTADLAAVRAGLASPHSSGVVEGRVNDLKLIKRQMFGRAGPRLLERRVVLVAHSRRNQAEPDSDGDPWSITGYQNLG